MGLQFHREGRGVAFDRLIVCDFNRLRLDWGRGLPGLRPLGEFAAWLEIRIEELGA